MRCVTDPPSRIQLVEVAPRDGLQAEERTLPTETKLELLSRLADAGHTIIEATSLVSPTAVPQLADAIVEVTETGASLRANRLRIVDTVLESATVFIMNRQAAATSWKREKAENLILMLQGAIAAASKVGLLLNVHRDDLQAVLGVLPALKKPTISALSDPEWVAINTIVEEAVVRQILPRLKAAKAQGIVEYPLNKIVL